MPKILIPDAEEKNIRQIVICLSCNKSNILYLLSNSKKNHIKYSKNCKCFFTTEDSDYSIKRLEKVTEIIRKNGIDIILPTSVPGYQFVISNINKIKKITSPAIMPSETNYNITARKDYFATFCLKNNISTPKTFSINDSKDGLTEKLNFPVLLKPIEGDGGLGIEEFCDSKLFSQFLNNNYSSLKNKFIAQEYIHGISFCASVLCLKGKILTYTIQKGVLPIKRKFSFPKGVELIDNNKLLDLITPLFRKLDWNGIANIDILYDNRHDKLYVLEVNPRAWGTMLASLHGGINFLDLLVKKSLDQKYEAIPLNYDKVIFAYLNTKLLLNIFFGTSKIKIVDTNFRYLISDPLPTVFAGIYSMRRKLMLQI